VGESRGRKSLARDPQPFCTGESQLQYVLGEIDGHRGGGAGNWRSMQVDSSRDPVI
jgi:hypothetical protein